MGKELVVVTKAKDLCKYVITITKRCPKEYRFTFTSRLQNLSMDIVEYIYQANDIFVSGSNAEQYMMKRRELQHKAITKTQMLLYFAQLAAEEKVILPKQYAQISKQGSDVINMLGAWIKSERNRFQ